MDIFSDSFDPKRDLPKERVIAVDNGVAFHITQEDPHGFWYVHREKGQIPAKLSGAYTTFQKAQAAVNLYISSLPKKEEVKEKKVS